ncbi:MAG: beta-propeller domain-containing protein [Lachnospiraceae bacterium]|nr:beta-propeller domain-containing protein [Lachnospiraceae bacterium]
MKVHRKKRAAVLLPAALLVSLLAGCGRAETVSFPTPTPRGIKEPTAAVTPPEPTETPDAENDRSVLLQPAGTYEKVYEVLETVRKSRMDYPADLYFDADGVLMAWPEDMNEGAGMDYEYKTEDAYSQTNVQVEGIDEADIIKTDGSYLYIFNANRSEIYIVGVNRGDMKLTVAVNVKEEDFGRGSEMYLLEDRLVLVTSGRDMTDDAGKQVTEVLTYDISDKSAPKLLSSLKQDGSLISSRCTGGVVYLITSYGNLWWWYDEVFYIDEKTGKETEEKTEKPDRYIPKVEGERIAADCIYISEEPNSEQFLVLTAMSPKEPQKFLDVKSLMADGSECYVSNSYIYVGSSRWQNEEISYNRTELYRFAYGDGKITPAGQVTVKGTVNNQFSLDEYNGYLRVVTTVNEYDYERYFGRQSNALYIYDRDLRLTGSIENLAPEEHIKSARFMGDVGYFVTFRQTDPLFSVDLSAPSKPVVLGELKIPGFSEYLHPYGENLLLGIGYDVDDERGNFTSGVKLSMFDVSDPTNVIELHKVVLEEFSSTTVSNNHKAALIDTEKNIIGIPVWGYGYSGEYNNGEYNVFLVFGYDKEKGFYQKFSEGYALTDWVYPYGKYGDYQYDLFYADCRGVYIGDVLYLINPSYEVRAYDMSNWGQIGRVGLVKAIEEQKKLISRIEKENPEPLVIELEANPSMGYSWVVTTEGPAVMLLKAESVISEGTEMLPGSPVTLRYTFYVCDIGKSKITFEYGKMWESNPFSTIVYEVSVREDLQIMIESVTES